MGDHDIMGTVMSHYNRGYYCKNLHACIAVDQFHKETFSPGNENLEIYSKEKAERESKRTNIYRWPAGVKRKRYGSGRTF